VTETSPVKDIDPSTLERWLAEREAVLVDVRPPEMFAEEHIAGARSIPLSTLEASALPALDGKRLVFQCKVGISSEKAGRKVLEQGFAGDVFHLAGGITAWKRDGKPVERGRGPAISIQRQVQMVAGALVLVGVVLGAIVSPWWLALSGTMGAGLFLSGATGSCAMAAMLARLPFNRR
jgi:rhodanese-related sulfurtransferase